MKFMHRNRQVSLYIVALFFSIATTAQISELKVSEIPNFENAISSKGNFWGNDLIPQKAVRIYLQSYFEKRPVLVTFFYQKNLQSDLVKLQEVEINSKLAAMQIPHEGFYWVKVTNSEGEFVLMQFASEEKGFAKAIFRKK